MREVVDVLVRHAVARWAPDGRFERQDVAWRPHGRRDRPRRATVRRPERRPRRREPLRRRRVPGERLRIRLRQAGVDPGAGLAGSARKPPWLRVPARMGDEFLGLRRTVRDLGLVTVCEEAGCPNIFECWADGTATFMINGERCTRACGFCLVDTRHPEPPDAEEPDRVAEAVERLGPGLRGGHRGGPRRPRRRRGGRLRRDHRGHPPARARRTAVEVLIPDCKGDPRVAGHDLRRRVPTSSTTTSRPWPACSAPCGPRPATPAAWPCWPGPRTPGSTTKSGMILGMGETRDEVRGRPGRPAGRRASTSSPSASTCGPPPRHLPVARWWTPEEFESLRAVGEALGFAHVEASPLTRSSYHARGAAAARRGDAAATAPVDATATGATPGVEPA